MTAKVISSLVFGSLLAGSLVVVALFVGGDRRTILIGRTTDAHHQIEMSCETCHGSASFDDAATAEQTLNKSCRDCHDDELDDADDSHPRSDFRNPRMAAYWEKLDARLCTSCHEEHRPEITGPNAVTVAMDFCVACHAEGDQDVRADRPSHADATFDSCASAGCHNFHDNRALYEDFLVKHAGGPWLAESPLHALSATSRTGAQPEALSRSDALAPAAALADSTVLEHWVGSGHAAARVGCAACHAADLDEDATLAEIEGQWADQPPMAVCADCHRLQSRTYALGRHGMRAHPKIAKPRDPRDPLEKLGLDGILPERVVEWLADRELPEHITVAEARLPMRADAAHRTMDCGACHAPHDVDTRHAAVEACSSCHDDAHTRAYFGSAHHRRWRAELGGESPPGSGVSCATCHMTKTERRGQVTTNHNQNDNLRPNEKMIRPVCLDCHGLGFSLDALADAALVERNFDGKPSVHVESIDWAVRRVPPAERGPGG